MDMRALDFADETFDFVWSISSVEHVDSVEDIVTAFREVERVLKPGGHALITSEWNLVAENPVYEPGAIILDEVLMVHVLSQLRLLRLTQLSTTQPYHPAHVYSPRWKTSAGVEVRPIINIRLGGTYVTPVLMVLQREATSP
jgi:SAM-dependent methyltransferase